MIERLIDIYEGLCTQKALLSLLMSSPECSLALAWQPNTRHAIHASQGGRSSQRLTLLQRSNFLISYVSCLIRLTRWSVTAMTPSQGTKPVFPLEIWSTVFSNFRKDQEIVHLWTDCRHVCRQFRDDVERIFSIKHLSKTTITFDCGRSALKA